MQKRALILMTAVLVLYLAGSLFFIQVRPINGDEGYFASAARLVAEGQTPYIDFFYPQTPILPYLYAPVYLLVGSSLVGLRILSAILGTVALLFWGLYLRRRFPQQGQPVLLGLLLLAMNPYFLVWNVTVKTFAASNLAVLVVIWAWEKGRQEEKGRSFVILGMALGALLGFRLLYGPWIAFVMVLILWQVFGPRRLGGRILSLGHFAYAAGGLIVGLLPTLQLMVRDFDAFYFNNVRYHVLRHAPVHSEVDPIGFTERFSSTSLVFAKAMFANPFMLFIVILAIVGTWNLARKKDPQQTAFLVFAGGGFLVHTLASLVPFPSHEQYFTAPLAPLLAPLALAGIVALAKRLPGPMVWLVMVAGLSLSVVDLAVRHTGMDMAEHWSLQHLEKVTRGIEAETEPDDVVLAFWPGYTFESGRQFITGTDNHFGVEISERLTYRQKMKYHIPGKELFTLIFEQKEPDMIVLGTWMNGINSGLRQEDITIMMKPLNDNYEVVSFLGEVQLCMRQQEKHN
jgi:hypothetical protein